MGHAIWWIFFCLETQRHLEPKTEQYKRVFRTGITLKLKNDLIMALGFLCGVSEPMCKLSNDPSGGTLLKSSNETKPTGRFFLGDTKMHFFLKRVFILMKCAKLMCAFEGSVACTTPKKELRV